MRCQSDAGHPVPFAGNVVLVHTQDEVRAAIGSAPLVDKRWGVQRDVWTAVEEEMRRLVGRLPQHDRALVRAMCGYDDQPARHGAELRREFKLTNTQIKDAMRRSLRTLWFAHLIDKLPAIRAALGDDRSAWLAGVWEHTDHILDREARTRYAQLLLVLGGTPADEVETVSAITCENYVLASAKQNTRCCWRGRRVTARGGSSPV